MTQVNLSKKSKQADMQIRPAVAKGEGGEGEVGVWGEQMPSITRTHTHTHTHIYRERLDEQGPTARRAGPGGEG